MRAHITKSGGLQRRSLSGGARLCIFRVSVAHGSFRDAESSISRLEIKRRGIQSIAGSWHSASVGDIRDRTYSIDPARGFRRLTKVAVALVTYTPP